MSNSRFMVSVVMLALTGCFQASGGDDENADTSTDSGTSTSPDSTSTETSTDTMDAGSEEVGGGCGDGLIAIDEECDGENLGNASCESLGYFGGALACTDTCTLDVSGCQMESICGNGIAEGDEVCDGGDFAGENCQTIGDFIDGVLMCSESCDEVITIACLSPGEGGMCAADADCPMEAPACVNGACWNGSETDPCEFNSDCELNNCVSGQCWDGTEGDPCLDSSNCSEFVPFCNGIDMLCHDGDQGDPCETIGQCNGQHPFCVSNTCQTGEPGSPCMNNSDCISDSCDVVNLVCE